MTKPSRKIIEKEMGIKLTAQDVVHHKDGNQMNNNLENLQLMTRKEHYKLHAELKYKKNPNDYIILKCAYPLCLHEWKYRGHTKKGSTSCPKCLNNVTIPERDGDLENE